MYAGLLLVVVNTKAFSFFFFLFESNRPPLPAQPPAQPRDPRGCICPSGTIPAAGAQPSQSPGIQQIFRCSTSPWGEAPKYHRVFGGSGGAGRRGWRR